MYDLGLAELTNLKNINFWDVYFIIIYLEEQTMEKSGANIEEEIRLFLTEANSNSITNDKMLNGIKRKKRPSYDKAKKIFIITKMDGVGTQAPDNLYDFNQLIIYLRNIHKLYICSNRNYNLLIRKKGQDCVLEITSTSSVKDLMGLSYENELEIFKKYSDLLSTMLIF